MKATTRYPGLDTLRAGAILLVMLFHLQEFLPAALGPIAHIGWAGVDLFFVLSGFLIGSQLMRPYIHGGRPCLRAFYLRRSWRILPAYLVVLTLYLVWPLWREFPGPAAPWQYFTFTWNLALIGYPEAHAFSHVWSLCVEEHFYLLLPALLFLLMRKPSARRTGAVLAVITLGGLALRAYLFFHTVRAPGSDEAAQQLAFMRQVYYPTYTRLDGLVTGVSIALVRTFQPTWWAAVARRGHLLTLGGVAVLGAAVALVHDGYPGPAFPASCIVAFPVLALGFGLLTMAALAERSLLTLRVPGAGALAALSFSLYLTHKSVVHVLRASFPSLTAQPSWFAAGVYLCGCLGASLLLFTLVERPCLALRARLLDGAAPASIQRQMLDASEVAPDPAI